MERGWCHTYSHERDELKGEMWIKLSTQHLWTTCWQNVNKSFLCVSYPSSSMCRRIPTWSTNPHQQGGGKQGWPYLETAECIWVPSSAPSFVFLPHVIPICFLSSLSFSLSQKKALKCYRGISPTSWNCAKCRGKSQRGSPAHNCIQILPAYPV